MKLTNRTNFRVVVYPVTRVYGLVVAKEEERCVEIVEQIKRHVDHAESVEIVHDEEPVCSHCGRNWTEDSDTYNGGCCAEDQNAHDAVLGMEEGRDGKD